MSAISMLKRKCKQTAVYWNPSANDGYGKFTFDSPEEIKVRWEDALENMAKDSASRIKIDKDGKEYRSSATVYAVSVPTNGWNIDGYLYLGTIDDLPSSLSPYDTEDAYEIKNIKQFPNLANNETLFILDL